MSMPSTSTAHPVSSNATEVPVPDDVVYRRRWWTLAILSLSLLIIGLDNTVLNVAIPTLQEHFSASASELQWMVDSYIVVYAGLLLTLGAAGDRFGRARALQLGLLVFGLSSFWAAYAGSANQLIAARAVMGIGGALIMPSTLSVLTNVFPREERGKAIAIWSAVAGAGIGLGPLVGGVLLDSFWWGSVFLINVPIVVAALVFGWWLVPESRDEHAPSLDIIGSVLSISAISMLVYAIIEAPNHGWTDSRTSLAFALAVFLGGAFFWRETTTEQPMLDLAFFRNPRFSLGAAAIGLTFFGLFGAIFAMTQYLQFVQGYTALEAGLRLVPMAAGVMVGAGSSNKLVDRLGTTKIVTGGMLIVTGVLTSIVFWRVDTPYWVVGGAIFLLAAGMGNVMAPSTDAVMGAVPEAKAGVGSAMNDVVRQVGGAFGVAVIGSILNTAYTGRMDDATAALPAEAAGPAQDSVGAALVVAARVGGPAGEALAAAARVAFTDAMGVATVSAAGVTLISALLVARFLPARHRPLPEEV
jgi:EmrB/QacA subfamily drug resistance transporter